MLILTIDCGTTDTRISFYEGNACLLQEKRRIGVRDTKVEGQTEHLQTAIHEMIYAGLSHLDSDISQVQAVLASGMITSNLGLLEVPHIPAPVGAQALAASMVEKIFPHICDLPITFIPGVKNTPASSSLDAMDFMRGEETECIGLFTQIKPSQTSLFLMPGSHLKAVMLTHDGQIARMITTLSGEMLSALGEHTLLRASLEIPYANELQEEALWQGAQAAAQMGLSRAAFLVRTMERMTRATQDDRASFLLGAVCQMDVMAILNSACLSYDNQPVYITGWPNIQKAYQFLLAQAGVPKALLHMIQPYQNISLAGQGALEIYRNKVLS